MKGVAGQLRVPPEFVAQAAFPLPPLAEQQRIVDEIEKQFSRLDAAVEMLLRVERNLERLRTATLKAAVEGRLVPTEAELARVEGRGYEPADVLLQRILRERRVKWEADQLAKMKEQGKTPKDDKWKNKYAEPTEADLNDLPEVPDGWKWVSLEQLSDETRAITYGVVKLGTNVEDGVPILRSSNVRHLRFDLKGLKRIAPSIASDYKRTFLQGGEILITVRGTLGGVAVAPTSFAGYNISREVAMVALVDESVGNAIALFIGSPTPQTWLLKNAKGIAYTGINIETLKEMPIPLPPLAEQERIVTEVEWRISVIEELKTLVANALRRAAILRQKILRDAFAGKLVPQDSADEPASILLERIHGEKAAREAEADKARKERRGNMKGRKGKPSERKPRRPLREVLTESKRRLTPEQLFAEAGFTLEVVEDFYEELRREIKGGHIEQVRPDNANVYLIASNV